MSVQTDHEQDKDKPEKASSGSRRVIYSSDSDEESDDEKEASAGKPSGQNVFESSYWAYWVSF